MPVQEAWLILAGLLCALGAGGVLLATRRSRRPKVGFPLPAGQALAQNLDDGVLALDGRGRVVYFNPAAQSIFGAEPLLDRPLVELLAVWWQPALQLWEEGRTDFECSLRGGSQPHSYRLHSLPQPDGSRILLLRDLSAQRGLERRLEALENTDALTGLVNRARLLEIAGREVYRARRYHRSLSAVMIRVNDFGALNERLGYAAGEQVLVALAQRCRENIRLADSLARWGEDTFALLLPETDLEQGRLAAERIRRILSGTPIPTRCGEVEVSLSAGVSALSETPSLTADLLLDQAAGALFAGRGGLPAGRRPIAAPVGELRREG